MGTALVRVLVVDHDPLVRRVICGILRSQPDITIVCEVSNVQDALRVTRELEPDFVFMETSLSMISFETVRQIKHDLPDTHIVILSRFDSAAFKTEARIAGASGFIMKDSAAHELIPELRRIQAERPDSQKHIRENSNPLN
jgi:DNA-binding NarL/FixJ family response regulator